MGIPVLYQGSKYAPVPFVTIPPPADPAPELVSSEIGTVNAFTLVVTFNENISASNYGTGVTIKVNGTATSITSATRQSNHAIVRYVIPVLWHGSSDAVTWEYDSATGNIVAENGGAALGDVTAQSVTNNCEYEALLDLQADTLALNDNDPVSTWTDQSGNGRDFTQTGTERPTKQTIGGYPVVVADGVNDSMLGGDWGNALTSFTCLFMIRSVSVSFVKTIINKLDVDNYIGWSVDIDQYQEGDSDGIHYFQDQIDWTLIPKTSPHVVTESRLSNSAVETRRDSVINGTDSSNPPVVPATTIIPVQLFRQGDGSLYGFTAASICAVLFCAPAPNAANRAALETRLGARYGLTVP